MPALPRRPDGLPQPPASGASASDWQAYAQELEAVARAGERRAGALHDNLNRLIASPAFKLLRKARGLLPTGSREGFVPLPGGPVPAVSGSPSVTILIPFRDQARLLARCLQSLRAVTPPARLASAGVILIDNGSVQSATKKLLAAEARRSEVRVLRIDEPFNYARLNNRAAELATGEFLLLLNNDIEIVLPHWLDALLHAAQQPQTGAVGAKLLFPDGRIQHAGVELGLGDIAGHPFRLAPSHTPAASRPRECSAVTGACLLTPRALYNRLGGLDETHLPVAYNDVDYCLRVREAGLRVLYEPQAVLLHHESVSRGAVNDPREAAYMVRRWARAFDDPFKTQ